MPTRGRGPWWADVERSGRGAWLGIALAVALGVIALVLLLEVIGFSLTG